MKTFKDNAARTWTVSITIGAVKRVRDLLPGINLAEVSEGEPPLLLRLQTDVILFCDVLYALVKPDADKLAITDVQFAEGLGGDAILAAHQAFWQELTDFFRQLGRAEVAAATAKLTALVQAVIRSAEAKIEAIDVEDVARRVEGFSPTSTGSPGSSASTPPA